jgi:4-aminobutyrate aminotransferase-like enzyme/Ser/Thr protein kinase RdoA (MazF antagonist)
MNEFGTIDAPEILRGVYGLDGRLTPLPSEYDRNFLVEADGVGRFVLKVMRRDMEPGLVDLQCAALAHLAARDPSLVVPRVHPTAAGKPTDTVLDAEGAGHTVWMLYYIDGRVMASASPHDADLMRGLGGLLGRLDDALEDFSHPGAIRDMKWDLARAAWIGEYVQYVTDPSRRSLAERIIAMYEAEVSPVLPDLRTGVIHNDANDYNVIVDNAGAGAPLHVVGIVDYGDMVLTATVCEPAIGAAYALLGKRDPLAAAGQVVAGYHRVYPLRPAEVSVLFPLICMRLAVSAVNSAHRKTIEPDDPYVTVTEEAAWEALERLAGIHPRFAHYAMRAACGWAPVPGSEPVVSWLRSARDKISPVLGRDLGGDRCLVADLGVGSLLLGANPAASETPALTETVFNAMKSAGAEVLVGRYGEARPLYSSPIFGGERSPIDERRTIHLGMDLFVEPRSPVHAPLAGTVHVVANNARQQDYGPLVILRHATEGGDEFFTLYGHLGEDTFELVSPGDPVSGGQRIGSVGAPPSNGDWPPHLHFQLIVDLLDMNADFPGVGYASQCGVWRALSPDPNVVLGVPAARFPGAETGSSELMARRQDAVGPNLSVSYRKPLQIVRGWMQYLYDETGRAYIDLYNNVPHVGHCHPRVVEAVQRQVALLNTNTRYLHRNMVTYAERLAATMPASLAVCYFLNSASEANELALRLARAHTGRRDVIVHQGAYHGHTTTLIDISPYKFDGPGGKGAPPWVHVAPIADDYRGPYKRDDPEAGRKYAEKVAVLVERLRGEGAGPAAFIAESCPSVGGQIVFPNAYLKCSYQHVRNAGGLCIADEVQVGFGRLGTHFWGFEAQGVVPDIVVLGKPIGNGFPLAAVVTTREVAASFDNGMEFFSTFGGNPVACAAGLAVLDVVQEGNLQRHALQVGKRLLSGLEGLKGRHAIVGDVRGSGLFAGVELVRDRETLEPATEEARYVVDRLCESGVLAGTDGLYDNVIKLRGPLALVNEDIDVALEVLDEVLGEDPVRI